MSNFFIQLHNDNAFSLIIEDDGKVAYAYLLHEENIISDVWLYNVIEPSPVAHWDEKDMPFLNPLDFLTENISIEPLKDANDIQCEWILGDNGDVDVVLVTVRDSLIAKLAPGAKPGWSKLVTKDGPLAKVWL